MTDLAAIPGAPGCEKRIRWKEENKSIAAEWISDIESLLALVNHLQDLLHDACYDQGEWEQSVRADERARGLALLSAMQDNSRDWLSPPAMLEWIIEQLGELGPVEALPMSVLRQENEKLREAVRRIEGVTLDREVRDIAREALEEQS